MTTPAYPPTRALLLPIVRHHVAEILDRAERLARGRGTEGHDLEHDELEVWFATIPLHDTLRSTLSAPWSADDPIDTDNALCWLHHLVGVAEPNGQDPIPPGWREHVARLSTPQALGALREILERLSDSADMLRVPSAATARPEAEGEAYLALIHEHRRGRRGVQARLLEYMQSRECAQFHDVATEVHGDEQTSDGAIRANVARVNESLLAAKSPVRFTVGSGQIFKNRDVM